MSPWRVAGTALATIVLAGCMIGPNYERAAPSLPASYPDVPPATATSAAAPVVRPDWWMLYGDATLDRLVATALSDNLDVAVAVARIEEADALLREVERGAVSGGRPRRRRRALALEQRRRGAVVGANQQRRAGRIVDVVRDRFLGPPAPPASKARAPRRLPRTTRSDVVTLSLAGLTTQSYFSLRSLDAQITATRETLATRDEYYTIVQRRSAAGLASGSRRQSGPWRARRCVGAAQGTAAAARARRASAGHADRVTSIQARARRSRAAPRPADAADPASLRRCSSAARTSVRRKQNLIAANAQIGVAKAALFPRISLTGAFGGESDNLASLLSTGGRSGRSASGWRFRSLPPAG